ncbi:MAG: DUF2202 domain-containing protein [Candidatus Bipolaricaulota bacterium]
MKLLKNENSILLTLILTLVGGLMLTGVPTVFASTGEEPYGAENVTVEETYTLGEMLNYAIQDEYRAREKYKLIIDEMDGSRPFTNIVEAEETHIELLKPLFETHGIDLPEDDAASYTLLPESIDEALKVGIQAEIANIAMYEKFLSQNLPGDVEAVFQRLKNASQNHLRAFQNASSFGAGAGNRSGNSGNRRARGSENRRVETGGKGPCDGEGPHRGGRGG